MTRDELMVLYRRKITTLLRQKEALHLSTLADQKAEASMLDTDIEAGFEADRLWKKAYRECNAATEAFVAASREYEAQQAKDTSPELRAQLVGSVAPLDPFDQAEPGPTCDARAYAERHDFGGTDAGGRAR